MSSPKLFVLLTLAYLVFGAVGQAHAGDLWYVDTPATVADGTPTEIGCIQTVRKWPAAHPEHVTCVNDDLPQTIQVKYSDGERTWIEEESTTTDFECRQYCTAENGEDIGVVVDDSQLQNLTNQTMHGTITRGYYLVIGGDDKGVYQYGTGPYADDYRMWWIEAVDGDPNQPTEQTTQSTTSSSNQSASTDNSSSSKNATWVPEDVRKRSSVTYIACRAYEDDCLFRSTDGDIRTIDRDAIPDYIRPASDPNPQACDPELCYARDGTVVGYNPETYN